MITKKIFICDDDGGITDMLQMVLEVIDADVESEKKSLHAYERICKNPPHVLIVDLWMPIISGDQLIRKVRNNRELDNTHIICISASRFGEDIAINAGADLFIAKPFDMNYIIDSVEAALQSNTNTTV